MAEDLDQDLRRQIEALERRNKLLTEGLRQAERLRQLWGDAVQELKAARAELSASREFLDQVLAVSPDPIVVADQHGRMMLVNLAAARLVGTPRENLVGRHVLRLLTPAERKKTLPKFRDNWSDGAAEFAVLGQQGTRLVAVDWTVLRGGKGATQIVLAGRDITEHRHNERLLEFENAMLAAISGNFTLPEIMETLCHGIEAILDGALCSIQLLDNDSHRLHLGAAPSLPGAYNQAIEGIAIGPAVGSCGTAAYSKNPVIVSDIAHDPLWKDFKALALDHGLAACWSMPILTSSGAVLGTFAIYHHTPYSPAPRELQAATRAAHLASIAIQRKHAEQALFKSESQLKEITAALGEGVYVLDADGLVTFANPEMEKILGWTAAELVGNRGHDLFHYRHPDGSPNLLEDCVVHQSIRHSQTRRSLDDHFVRKDGTIVPVSIVSSPIMHEGKVTGAVAAFQDITERKHAQDSLHAAALYTRSLIEASLDPLVTISPEGKITDVNQASEEVTGITRDALIGTDFADYFTEPEMARAGYKQALERGMVRDYPLTIRHRSGRMTDVLYNANVYRNEAGELCGVFAAARDITERKKTEQQIHQLVYYDTLTNLPNRRLLLDRLNHALTQAKRHQRPMALMFLDLDHFKQINDTLGHDAGDELLKEVATRLNACVRSGDTVSRQGGDEFVILLAEIGHSRDATRVAEKILDTLGQPITIETHVLSVTTSIGIAVYSGGPEDTRELMKNADKAMYLAKKSGRNQYQFYQNDMQ